MKVVNLTPHELTIVSEGKVVLAIPASGSLARCAQQTKLGNPIEVDGVRVSTGYNVFGEVNGLPAPQEGTVYFVSALVAQAAWAAGRTDVVCPLSAVRDDAGRIIGTSGFASRPVTE